MPVGEAYRRLFGCTPIARLAWPNGIRLPLRNAWSRSAVSRALARRRSVRRQTAQREYREVPGRYDIVSVPGAPELDE